MKFSLTFIIKRSTTAIAMAAIATTVITTFYAHKS